MIRAALIGLGRIASLLEDDPLREKPATHAGALAASDRCAIVGGYDHDSERRSAFERRWDAPVYESAVEMIQHEIPDIVVIATHPDSHEQYVRTVVRANVPVVVCEKPLAHTVRSARRIAALEATGTTRFLINHERRFSNDYVIARQLVRAGSLGTLCAVHGRLYFGRSSRQDRVLLHDGTHLIDAIHFLSGETLRVRRRVGSLRRSVGTTWLHGILNRSQAPVALEIGSARDYLLFEATLSFTAGQIRIGNGLFSIERSAESPYYSGYRSLVDLRRNVPEPTRYFSGMIAEAVRLVRDPQAVSRSRAADALAVMRVVSRAGRFW